MTHRTAVLCLLLGCSLTITQVGCSSGSIPASQISTPSPVVNIQHIVVIFQENVSFDHYFATYPNALNLPGETPFTALPGTPAVDGLSQSLSSAEPQLHQHSQRKWGQQSLPLIASQRRHS